MISEFRRRLMMAAQSDESSGSDKWGLSKIGWEQNDIDRFQQDMFEIYGITKPSPEVPEVSQSDIDFYNSVSTGSNVPHAPYNIKYYPNFFSGPHRCNQANMDFSDHSELISIPSYNRHQVSFMISFHRCYSLRSLPVLDGSITISSHLSFAYPNCFEGCTKLKKLLIDRLEECRLELQWTNISIESIEYIMDNSRGALVSIGPRVIGNTYITFEQKAMWRDYNGSLMSFHDSNITQDELDGEMNAWLGDSSNQEFTDFSYFFANTQITRTPILNLKSGNIGYVMDNMYSGNNNLQEVWFPGIGRKVYEPQLPIVYSASHMFADCPNISEFLSETIECSWKIQMSGFFYGSGSSTLDLSAPGSHMNIHFFPSDAYVNESVINFTSAFNNATFSGLPDISVHLTTGVRAGSSPHPGPLKMSARRMFDSARLISQQPDQHFVHVGSIFTIYIDDPDHRITSRDFDAHEMFKSFHILPDNYTTEDVNHGSFGKLYVRSYGSLSWLESDPQRPLYINCGQIGYMSHFYEAEFVGLDKIDLNWAFGKSYIQKVADITQCGVTSCESMYDQCNNLTQDSINLDGYTGNDFSSCESMFNCTDIQGVNNLPDGLYGTFNSKWNRFNMKTNVSCGGLFMNCDKLRTGPQLDNIILYGPKLVTYYGYTMFQGCSNLQSLDHVMVNQWPTDKPVFYGCDKLVTLDGFTDIDRNPIQGVGGHRIIFACKNLQNISVIDTTNHIDLRQCDKLTEASVQSIIYNLPDVTKWVSSAYAVRALIAFHPTFSKLINDHPEWKTELERKKWKISDGGGWG